MNTGSIFICTCNQQNNMLAKTMGKNDIINVADVLDLKPGDTDEPSWVNGILQCVITKVKDSEGKGPIRAYLCHPDDSDVKITANFWKRDYDDIKALEGKLVSMSGGMTRTVYKPKQGPKIQQVSVTSKTEIEEIGESAHADKPLPHKPSPHRDTPATQQRAPECEETATQQELTDTDRRAKCYFGVFFSVEKAYREAKDAGLKTELSATDLKDITTGISLTYRGQYGSYMEPLFPKRGGAKPNGSTQKKFEEEMSEKDIPFEDEAELSWKEFEHPTTGKKLGELGDDKLTGYARWAVGFEPDFDDDGRPFWEAVQSMMKERHWTDPSKILAHSLLNHQGYGESFEDADINKAIGSDIGEMDEGECLDAIERFDEIVDSAKEAFKARKSKAGKSSKVKRDMPE